jgi:hypothetical protein
MISAPACTTRSSSGVQIAVAGVEDVADAQPVRGDDGVHAVEHVRQLRPGDHAVHHHVGRRDAAVGAERRLAALPQQLPLRLVAGRAHLARAAVAAGGHDALRLGVHAGGEPVELDQQRGRGVARIAASERWSIISIAAGTSPRAMISDTACEAWATTSKTARTVFTAWGFLRMRTTIFVAMPKVPSEPTKMPGRS